MGELVARIGALVRRASGIVARKIAIGALEIDIAQRAASLDGSPVDFTPGEFALVMRLAASYPNVVTKSELQAPLGYHAETDSHALKQFVWRMRKKLGTASLQIEAVPGVGYRLAVEPLSPRPASPARKGV